MTSLLELATEAIEGVDGFDAPESIIGSDDLTAILLKNVATQIGRELVREVRWQALKKPFSFNTVSGTAAYALPVDFQRFANLTFWNTSEGRDLLGPQNAVDWASLTRGGVTIIGVRYAFAVYGGSINLLPAPSSAQTIGLDYYSSYFCTGSTGTPKANWSSDTDIWRLDTDLAVLGIRYRFRARKGLPFAEEKADYQAAIAALQFDDSPKPMIDVSGVRRGRFSETFAFYGVASSAPGPVDPGPVTPTSFSFDSTVAGFDSDILTFDMA